MIAEPQGNDRLALWLRKLAREVNSQRITSVLGGRFSRGSQGTQIVIDAQSSLRSRNQFRGLYDDAESYYIGDIVTVVGSGQGTYICQVSHSASSPHFPWLGENDGTTQYWAILMQSAQGFWA